MKALIQSGDQCLVISGLGRHKSPNLGLTVMAQYFLGEHSQHGRMWRCGGDGIQQLTDAGTYVTTPTADFASAWLQKIEPPELPAENSKKELETS